MATRSAMTRFLVAAVVFAVILSASAVDNTNFAKVEIKLKGLASDYLQISKRNQFCTSFSATLTATTNDLQSCVIVSAVNTNVVGEVAVTADFTFTAVRTAAAVATTLNTALNSGTPPSGFEKAANEASPATAAANQGTFPRYFAEVEIVTKAAITDANIAGNYATNLKTAIGAANVDGTIVCGPTGIAIANAVGGNVPATKFTCQIKSITKTRSELVALAKEKAMAVAGISDGTTAHVAVWVRDTGVMTDSSKYVIDAVALIGSTTATDLTTNFPNLRAALLAAFGVAADVTLANAANQVSSSASVDVKITVNSEGDANRVLETLKQLVASNVSAAGTTVNFPLRDVTSLRFTPGLFSDTRTVYPGSSFRYNIVISNTTSAFTSAPYQFRRVCESITTGLQGNASACSILEFNRPSGDAGTLSIEVTAVNSTAALSLSRGVVRAVAAIPVSTFALGTVTEVVPFPGQVTGGTVQITLGTPITTVAGVTTAVRNELCTQLSLAGNNQAATITTSGFVPGPNIVNCYITDADVVAGTTANTVVVTARVWWRLADFALADYVAGLKQALTNKAFGATGTTPAATIDYNAAITAIAAGTATAVFGFEADFHITMSSTDFAVTATTQAFAAAIATIVGNNAAVSIVRSVAATGLNPATGTLVTVRVFTASAATQAAAYTALAAQVAGNTTTIGSGTTFTLNPAGFRRVTFFPAVASSEFPVVPPSPPPATPPARPSTPPATPPPAQPPLPPLVVPVDNTGGDATTPVRSYRIVFRGTYTAAAMDSIVAAIRAKLNADFPGSIISIAVTDVITLGKKFVAQDYSVVMTIVSNNAASAAQLGQRLVNAFNSGAIAGAQVVSVTSVAPTTANPATPAAPTVPAAPPAPVAMTTGNIDITILGTRTSFTQTDQTALTSNVASAINGTASILTTTETSTNARKFTMQASALRVTMAVSAPAAQYPSVDSIINRLLSVRASQGNRLGNSSVVSITSAQAGAAARSGPVALTILVALLVAMLSAMAQF